MVATVYRFEQISNLFNFLEYIWREASFIPTVRCSQSSNTYYIFDTDLNGHSDFAEAARAWAQIETVKTSSRGKTLQSISLSDIALRIRAMPWQKEQDFSIELLVALEGNRNDFERERDLLFEVERGSRQRFSLEVALISPPADKAGTDASYADPFPCLLRIRGLHAYETIAGWLANERKFEMYYPYLQPVGLEALNRVSPTSFEEGEAAIYVQWGYELPPFQVLNAHFRDKGQLLLVRGQSQPRLFEHSPTFYPILHLLDVTIGEPAQPTHEQERSLKDSPVFQINMGLRPRPNSPSSMGYTEEFLQGRIDSLQFQLEKLRLEQGDTGVESRLYVYEEIRDAEEPRPDGLDELRRFVVRYPLVYLRRFDYVRLGLKLGDKDRVFHIVVPTGGYGGAPELRNLYSADYEFYLDRYWQQATGYNVYLPIDHDGRRLELFPPILPGVNDQADKLVNALLGDVTAEVRPNSSDMVLLWPDEEKDTILRVYILEKHLKNLRDACRYINMRYIEDRKPEVFSTHACKTIEQALLTTLKEAEPRFDRIASDIREVIAEAWQTKYGEIEHLLADVVGVLKQSDEVDGLRRELYEEFKEVRTRIRTIEASNWEKWNALVTAVCQMHGEIVQITPREEQRVRELWEKVQRDLEQTRADKVHELTGSLEEVRDKIRDLNPQLYLEDLPHQLRTLANRTEELGDHGISNELRSSLQEIWERTYVPSPQFLADLARRLRALADRVEESGGRVLS